MQEKTTLRSSIYWLPIYIINQMRVYHGDIATKLTAFIEIEKV